MNSWPDNGEEKALNALRSLLEARGVIVEVVSGPIFTYSRKNTPDSQHWVGSVTVAKFGGHNLEKLADILTNEALHIDSKDPAKCLTARRVLKSSCAHLFLYSVYTAWSPATAEKYTIVKYNTFCNMVLGRDAS